MIDEPYRVVEVISNRREYIENELATGSPTIGLSFSDGILLLTFGRDRRTTGLRLAASAIQVTSNGCVSWPSNSRV